LKLGKLNAASISSSIWTFRKSTVVKILQMETSLRNHVNRQIRACWEKYADHLGSPVVGPVPATVIAVNESDCIDSLDNLILRVAMKWRQEKPFAVLI
jgi:hypothetical protein